MLHRILLAPSLLIFLLTTLAGQSLDDPALDPAERRRTVREQEMRWNLREENLPREMPAEVRVIHAGAQSFQIVPGQTNELVLSSGTRITVPAGSLRAPRGASELRAEVLELRKPEDFAFYGIPTTMIENGKPLILESAGMVRLRFLWNTTEVLLSASARLKLEMAPAAPGEFSVYRRTQNGNWNLEGPAQKSSADCQTECPSVSTLIFDKIDRGGWWNFDRPTPEFTCVQGRVVGGASADVRGMGLYKNWVSQGQPADSSRSSDRFVMNVMRGEQTKVAAVVSKGPKAWIAAFPAFQTQTTVTHTKLEAPGYNGCQDIGSAVLTPVDPDTLQDKAKFLKAIGWEG